MRLIDGGPEVALALKAVSPANARFDVLVLAHGKGVKPQQRFERVLVAQYVTPSARISPL